MILNLNQVTFRQYGMVLPEKAETKWKHGKTVTSWRTEDGNAAVYLAEADTGVVCVSGTAVLCVSLDGEAYQHFYLDKPAVIQKGVYFSLTPFFGQASFYVQADSVPRQVGAKSRERLRMNGSLPIDGIYTFFYQEKEQGFVFAGESHPMWELTYVDQGSVHSVADGLDLLLKQGDLVLYGPDQWHMQYADIGVAPRYVTISFDSSAEVLHTLVNRKIEVTPPVSAILQSMLREQERMDDFSEDVILAQLKMLLLTILRETQAPTGAKLQSPISIHGENEIIRRAQQYICSNIRQRLTVPMVAKQVDVSSSYLTALFHKNLQIAPGEYIRRIKLQESKQMIRENQMNFTQIAAALQYSTVHHFSRQFKEKFGITPTEYARSVR